MLTIGLYSMKKGDTYPPLVGGRNAGPALGFCLRHTYFRRISLLATPKKRCDFGIWAVLVGEGNAFSHLARLEASCRADKKTPPPIRSKPWRLFEKRYDSSHDNFRGP
jgi:hypothetical protein